MMENLSITRSDDDRVGHAGHRVFGSMPEFGNGISRPAGKESKRPAYIIGPNGDVVTVADLPSPKATRWVIRRKAEVVLAVHAGLISREEACRRYRLTAEEFLSWQTAIQRHGLRGLRTTQLQQYRYGGKN
jgi:hypothetical protein